MAGLIPFFIVILFAAFVVWGSRPMYRVTAKTEGIVEEVRVETDHSIHTSGGANWGANRKAYRLYVRYRHEGRTYVGRSEQAFGTAKYAPGDRVTVGVNDVNRESVRILR